MDKAAITSDLPMCDILAKWPETIPVFLQFRMSCIGCYMASFDTLEEALKAHGLPIDPILTALNQHVAETNARFGRNQ